jgi:hypothetical protein
VWSDGYLFILGRVGSFYFYFSQDCNKMLLLPIYTHLPMKRAPCHIYRTCRGSTAVKRAHATRRLRSVRENSTSGVLDAFFVGDNFWQKAVAQLHFIVQARSI